MGITKREERKHNIRFYSEQIIIHSKYENYKSTHNNTNENPYDIAMIQLDRSVYFTRVNNYYKVNTICLPQENDKQEKAEMVHVMGWGLIDFGNKSLRAERLQMGYMNAIETPSYLPDGIMRLVMTSNNSATPCHVRKII